MYTLAAKAKVQTRNQKPTRNVVALVVTKRTEKPLLIFDSGLVSGLGLRPRLRVRATL